MDREAFFAVLDQLTLPQIEARLPLWDAEQLKFAEEYLDRNGVKYTQMEQDTRPNTEFCVSRHGNQILQDGDDCPHHRNWSHAGSHRIWLNCARSPASPLVYAPI